MTLYMAQLQYQRIRDALETAYPQEGCGVLVGKRVLAATEVDSQTDSPPGAIPPEAYREVVQAIPVANTWEPGRWDEAKGDDDPKAANDCTRDAPDPSSRHGAHDRYWIDPADLLRLQKQACDQGLEIIGIYHSHPDHPAVPSECDRRLAWPVYSYLIASVQGGQIADVQSWRLSDHQQFEPEAIMVQP